jgi:hypothetical protein
MKEPIRRIVPVLGVAVLVAALVLGIGSLRTRTGGGDEPRPGAIAQSSAESTIDLDLGPTTADDVATCLATDFATDASGVDVLYGVRQRRLGGSSPVLVLRNAAGEMRLCDQFGGDSPAQAPVPTASADRPVAFVSNGRSQWSCTGTTRVLERFQKSTWLAVSPEVARVQQRYWVDGVPGRWFESHARHGFVHLQTWVEGPQPATTKYAEQYRVLDESGDDVRQTALPTRRSALPGCSAGGSAEIG